MDLKALGKIKRITLPENWQEEVDEADQSEIQTFVHPQEPEVKFISYYRGKALSSPTASNLKRLLERPAHILTKEEILSIEVIFRDAAEAEYFEIKSAYTTEVNGVLLLALRGHWKLSELDSLGIFVNSIDEDACCRIDELYYLAPPDKFEKYLDLMQKSLESIEWQNSSVS